MRVINTLWPCRFEFSPTAFLLLTDRYNVGAVNVGIEHLLKESSIRNPSYFVIANTSMLL